MDFLKNLMNPDNNELLDSSPALFDETSDATPPGVEPQAKQDTLGGQGQPDKADGPKPDVPLPADVGKEHPETGQQTGTENQANIPPSESRGRRVWNKLKDTLRATNNVGASLLSPSIRNEAIAKFVLEKTDNQKREAAKQFEDIGTNADVKRDGAIADFGDGAKKLADEASERAKNADPRWKGFTSEWFKTKRENTADRLKARSAEMTAQHFAKKVDKYNRKLEPKTKKLKTIENNLTQEQQRKGGDRSFAREEKLRTKQRRLETKITPLQGRVEANKARTLALRENSIKLRSQLASRKK